MPMGRATATAKNRPAKVSSSEAGRRVKISSVTGRPVAQEVPQSPRHMSETYRRNCSMRGLSSPRFWRICSMASRLAEGPARYVAGSPGSARASRKVMMSTPARLGMAARIRRRMKRSIGCPVFPGILRNPGKRQGPGALNLTEVGEMPGLPSFEGRPGRGVIPW